MDKQSKNTLLSYWFIIALTVLLLNDFMLKEAFSNWFTGKLSDFAGLFVFVLFWTAAFPRYKRVIFIVTALLFSLWKSPLSEPFIEGWNSIGVLPIQRVVDLSDLLALSILPIAYMIENRSMELRKVRLSPVIPIVIAAFAFGATSYSTNEEFNKTYKVNVPKDSIVVRLDRLDSVNLLIMPKSDTLNLSIENELCHDRINIKLSVVEFDDSTSIVTLLNATHPCPRKEIQDDDILKSFENRVIRKIK